MRKYAFEANMRKLHRQQKPRLSLKSVQFTYIAWWAAIVRNMSSCIYLIGIVVVCLLVKGDSLCVYIIGYGYTKYSFLPFCKLSKSIKSVREEENDSTAASGPNAVCSQN